VRSCCASNWVFFYAPALLGYLAFLPALNHADACVQAKVFTENGLMQTLAGALLKLERSPAAAGGQQRAAFPLCGAACKVAGRLRNHKP
jgi:hypothetical protein